MPLSNLRDLGVLKVLEPNRVDGVVSDEYPEDEVAWFGDPEIPKIGGSEIGCDRDDPTVGGREGGEPDLLRIRRITDGWDLIFEKEVFI